MRVRVIVIGFDMATQYVEGGGVNQEFRELSELAMI
jgi:hypothetical protein